MKKKKWNNKRYGKYYTQIMTPIWSRQWYIYKKRIYFLKKDVLSLGKIPDNERQLIGTVSYFVKLINLATKFCDNGLVTHVPKDKSLAASEFNDIIVSITARNDGLAQYQNRAKFKETVNYNNLYLGMFVKLDPKEDITSATTIINGEVKKVEVNYAPLSDWLNHRVLSVDGHLVAIKQKDLAKVDKQLTDILLEVINRVLE